MNELVKMLLLFGTTIFFHELGHIIVALEQDIYDGIGLFPTPRVFLKRPFNSRWDYLSGIHHLFAFMGYGWLWIGNFFDSCMVWRYIRFDPFNIME